jgi:hypothetical protein
MERWRFMASAAAVLLLPSVGQAELTVGAQGGVFDPWDGDTGYAVAGHVLASLGEGHFRIGGEFEFRDYSSEFFGVSDVDVQSYHLRALAHYGFNPDGINPYAGLGLGIAVNVVDTDAIEAANPSLDVFEDVGFGIGAVGILGIEIPLGGLVSLYGEGRASVDVQLTDSDDVDVENLGGLSGLGGVRIRF